MSHYLQKLDFLDPLKIEEMAWRQGKDAHAPSNNSRALRSHSVRLFPYANVVVSGTYLVPLARLPRLGIPASFKDLPASLFHIFRLLKQSVGRSRKIPYDALLFRAFRGAPPRATSLTSSHAARSANGYARRTLSPVVKSADAEVSFKN